MAEALKRRGCRATPLRLRGHTTEAQKSGLREEGRKEEHAPTSQLLRLVWENGTSHQVGGPR